MEWQKLVGFYEAAICRSFTKASKRTFRTQSALSQQIQSLEKEFNCLLFERIGKRSLRLTLAGERLFSFVDNLMRRQRELIEDLHEITGCGNSRSGLEYGPGILTGRYRLSHEPPVKGKGRENGKLRGVCFEHILSYGKPEIF